MVDNTLPAEQKAAVEWKYTRLHDAAASIQASQYIALGMKYFFATHDNIRELVREQQESLEPAGYLIWQVRTGGILRAPSCIC